MNKVKYQVVTASGAEELNAAVNGFLAQGWSLQGGVAVSVVARDTVNERKGYSAHEKEWCFAQAMTTFEKIG